MPRARWIAVGVAVVTAAATSSSAPPRPPRVAVLATVPGAATTALYLVDVGATALPPAVASVPHAPGAVVRASVVPGTETVIAIADGAARGDLSFAARAWRLSPGEPATPLVDRVVHASRPLITASGRVFVSRGAAGPAPAAAHGRVDHLTIDELDPRTGTARTVYATDGYLAFLAGATATELVVYRIAADGASIVAIDPDRGAVRTVIADLPPLARDFSIAGGALIFEDRDGDGWAVLRVELATGAVARVATSDRYALAPFAWPAGGVAWSGGGRGVHVIGERTPRAPVGDGVDVAVAQAGALVALSHTVADALPVPFVLDSARGTTSRVPAPPGTYAEIAGFVP